MSMERLRTWFSGLGANPMASRFAETQESSLRSCVAWLSAKPGAGLRVDEVRSYLPSLPPNRLFDVDERLRGYTSPLYGDWPSNGVRHLLNSGLDPLLRQSLLFLSAGHPDGRVREAALRVLPSFPGYLTLAAALIRCADWVDEVQRGAQETVERLLPLCDDEDVVALWPMVLRLRSRERVSPHWFREHVEGWMLREQSRSSLRKMIGSRYAPIRAWAIKCSLEAKIELGLDLVDLAIRDVDPRIGLHALRYVRESAGDDDVGIRARAASGLTASSPIIRRESLQLLSELEGELSRDSLLPLLLDGSAGVRSRAGFILQNRFSEDPVQHWRATLDADAPMAANALAALADHAQPQDDARMRRWLSVPGGLTRAHALRGLVKAGGQPNDAELAMLLEMGGNRLLRPLRRLVSAGLVSMDVSRVLTIVGMSSVSSMAPGNLRELLKELNHWQGLLLLLQFPTASEKSQSWWNEAISDWVKTSDRHVPLGSHSRQTLLTLLEARRGQLRPDSQVAILAAIERH
ncbi:hypothetical protein [Pseudoxanthomonas sp. PXM04]|uniref:hypothetical protein n=1 Tax=Pseudoxanthomonas sp. PXM04 TaxID=2769297 RepID=UPI0017811E99|nr:hypothetical protein [Pseudoxanthomonas sp. PXM04]MBD9377605.1 hypothetical protein [Pseudoxanthomonas sp. PXM04]